MKRLKRTERPCEVQMSLCEGCLSVGRTLSPVPPPLQRTLAAVLAELVQGKPHDVANIMLCWECDALLRKSSQFKTRVCRAQQWLQATCSQSHNEMRGNVSSLSPLQIRAFSEADVQNSAHTDLNSQLECCQGADNSYIKLEESSWDVCDDVDTAEDIHYSHKNEQQNTQIEIERCGNKNAKKKTRTSKNKGKGYGYMYEKLEISEQGLNVMRAADCAEESFASAPLKCTSCIVAFRCQAILDKHNTMQHSHNCRYICKICLKRFGTKLERDRHQRSHYFCYKCKKCDLVFLERDAACRHYKKDDYHKHEKPEEQHPSMSQKIKHPSIHRDYHCHICNKMFTFKGYFTKHVQNHGGIIQYQCQICNKHFSKKAHLNMHMLSHSDAKPYKCNICKKCFSRKPNLAQHMLVHTKEQQHQCEICSRCFSQRGTLKQHMVTHTGEKAHRCEICSKSFTLKTGLKRHIWYHTGELPFQCDICNKGFPVKCNLKQHMLTHTRERPFKCSVCNKRYPLKATLKQHMILHTFDTKNQCDICKKCFTQAKSLRLHMMIHSGERPYGCEVCGKQFSYVQTLRHHTLTHTGELAHRCNICNRRFALKANLKKHLMNVHSNDATPRANLEISNLTKGNI